MEWVDFTRIVFALLAVLGLIGLAAALARKAGLAQAGFSLTRRKRLTVMESLALDARRRLVIVRCDDKEHLIVLGPAGETVVASGMEAAEAAGEAPAPVPLKGFAAQGFALFGRGKAIPPDAPAEAA
ncbi:MAG: FliO/MopB family protein [Parvularculaceae bacterium]